MAHTINGNAYSTYSAKLLEYKFTNHEVIQVYDWLEGAAAPTYMRNYNRFKDIELIILITETTDSAAEGKVNLLVQQMKNCVLVFDGISKSFACHFEGKLQTERIKYGVFKITASLACYKTYGTEVTETSTNATSKSITNSGTLASAMYITIVPSTNLSTFTITGLSSSPIVLSNLTSGVTYTIDGYTYRYLEAGANDIANYGAFEFPVLPVGTTNIGFSTNTQVVTLKYYPLFN